MAWRILPVGLLALAVGCSSSDSKSHITGKVTFKNEPVPAGWISFTPDPAGGMTGQTSVYQIKDGMYDTSQGEQPPLKPGLYLIRIAGFDGKKIPLWGQGKQIFNEIQDSFTVPSGSTTKDWVVPDAAGQNLKIVPTADT